MSTDASDIYPVVSKIFCSHDKVTLTVRKRPQVTNGGGFAVMNLRQQKILFSVNGCAVLGTDKELIVRDSYGEPILFVSKKTGGTFQALRTHAPWKGYLVDDGGVGSPAFILRQHKPCLFWRKRSNAAVVRISTDPTGKGGWNFVVKGSFARKACTITDGDGNTAAQVVEVEDVSLGSYLYQILVQPGYDQAFVVGIIAVLDNIHGESTRC